MAYHQFTLSRIWKEFSLTSDEVRDLFAEIGEVQVGPSLGSLLEE